MGTPPIQGTQAITAFITNIIAPFSEIKHKIQDINVCGHEAAVNWKIHLKTTTGKKIRKVKELNSKWCGLSSERIQM